MYIIQGKQNGSETELEFGYQLWKNELLCQLLNKNYNKSSWLGDQNKIIFDIQNKCYWVFITKCSWVSFNTEIKFVTSPAISFCSTLWENQ